METVYHEPSKSLVVLTDEKIKEIKSKETQDEYFKILALPEHLSPQQLQDIVDGKLKEGKCLLECQLWNSSNSGNTAAILEDGFRANDEYVIKLNPHITIYPVKEKMYTRVQMEEAFNAGRKTTWTDINQEETEPYYYSFDQWFEQNVK